MEWSKIHVGIIGGLFSLLSTPLIWLSQIHTKFIPKMYWEHKIPGVNFYKNWRPSSLSEDTFGHGPGPPSHSGTGVLGRCSGGGAAKWWKLVGHISCEPLAIVGVSPLQCYLLWGILKKISLMVSRFHKIPCRVMFLKYSCSSIFIKQYGEIQGPCCEPIMV